MMKVNINDTVKVKLTEYGRWVYKHQYDDLNHISDHPSINPPTLVVDNDGYSTFQIHDLIRIFGESVCDTTKGPMFQGNALYFESIVPEGESEGDSESRELEHCMVSSAGSGPDKEIIVTIYNGDDDNKKDICRLGMNRDEAVLMSKILLAHADCEEENKTEKSKPMKAYVSYTYLNSLNKVCRGSREYKFMYDKPTMAELDTLKTSIKKKIPCT